jgi:hypothetical protein
MIILKRLVCPGAEGCKHFSRRMKEYPEVFERATGEELYPGTLNVDVGRPIPIKEPFRIEGRELSEPEEFLFDFAAKTVCGSTESGHLMPWEAAVTATAHLGFGVFRRFRTPGNEVKIALFPRDQVSIITFRFGLRCTGAPSREEVENISYFGQIGAECRELDFRCTTWLARAQARTTAEKIVRSVSLLAG